jgi:hypothetical protein
MIQQLVDFFYIVGAPEEVFVFWKKNSFLLLSDSLHEKKEIEKLNVVGESINPDRIGSWINVSEKGGIDGGWCFTVRMSGVLICSLLLTSAASVSDQLGGGHQFCGERSSV